MLTNKNYYLLMWENNKLIVNAALRLTGATDFEANSSWHTTPPNWSCPVCKRSKLHITRVVKRGVLQGHMHDHHDHIHEYAESVAHKIIEIDKVTLYREYYSERKFINDNLCAFLRRFNKTLMCQDCNMADVNAKRYRGDLCSFFSFSPSEIASFIIPEAHNEHRIDRKKVDEVCSSLGDMHDYRLKLCDVLVSRAMKNERFWGDPVQNPCSNHYKSVKQVRGSDNLYDPHIIVKLQRMSDSHLTSFSSRLEKYEKVKSGSHVNNISDFKKNRSIEKNIKKSEKKEQLNKLIEDGVLFNHGKVWSNKDINLLISDFDSGSGYHEIATKLGRKTKSVKKRLKNLGYILD